jgi:hypothetical protein
MNTQSPFSRKLAIVLIVCAVLGTEISYHFTLETRFDLIEQKLQQDTVAMQQMQDSIDTLSSSKTETLAGLNKQVVALQSSFAPLGKMSHEQTDALAEVRQEIGTLQQAQNEQIDAQKKLSTGIAQMEKAREDARVAAAAAPSPAVTAPVAPVATAAPVPVSSDSTPSVALPAPAPDSAPASPSPAAAHALFQFPGAFSHAAKVALLPAAPNTSDAMDVRPADPAAGDTFRSVRALPVDGSIAR